MNEGVTREVLVSPRRSYWWGYLGIIFCGLYFAMMLAGLLNRALEWNLAPPEFRRLCLSLAVPMVIGLIIRGIRRDRRMLYWRLDAQGIRRGHDGRSLVIPFAEIESMVFGLPPKTHWLFKLAGIRSPGLRSKVEEMRAHTVLLRLSNRRLLPIYLFHPRYINGELFTQTLLDINRSKIVPQTSYTPAEIRKLGLASAGFLIQL